MGIRIVKDVDNVPKLMKTIKDLKSKRLEIGIFSSAGGEILLIANVHEYGAPSIGIPERSYLRAYFEKNEAKVKQMGNKLLEDVIANQLTADAFFKPLGEFLVGEVQKYMVDLKSPPNTAQTIARKGSSNPLVDSGQLVSSIDYRIV